MIDSDYQRLSHAFAGQGDFAVCSLPAASAIERSLVFFFPSPDGTLTSDSGDVLFIQPFDVAGRTPQSETSKETHAGQVKWILDKIQAGDIEKIVLSRVKHVGLTIDKPVVFDELLRRYPNAFVYYLRSAMHGEWMGASPEILIAGSNKEWKTISLAGTLPVNAEGNYAWTEKLRREQAVVTEEILRHLKEMHVEKLTVSEVYHHQAGPVVHLRQDIRFHSDKDANEIVSQLHPTPAVCGLPGEEARNIISKTELHQRRLYTGVIGFRSSDRVNYFVNLRCMQIFPYHVELFLGGGINAQSIPEDEWDETEHKARVLMNILGDV